MKKLILLLFLLFNFSFLFGQSIQLDKNGKVKQASTVIHSKSEFETLKSALEGSTKPIDDDLSDDKLELLNDIVTRLEASIVTLNSDKKQYELLFDDIPLIIADYNKVRDELKGIKNTLPHASKLRTNIFIALNSALSHKTEIESSSNKSFAEFKIYKPSLANLFYAEYYKLVYNESSIYKGLSKRDLFTELNNFKDCLKELENSLSNPSSYQLAHEIANEIESNPLFLLFKEQWLAQLLWLNKGEPRLNPFDNTSALLLSNNPGWRLSEDKTYQDFLDKVINQKLSSDTASNYKFFKEVLVEKNLLKARSSFKVIRDSLTKVNEQEFAKIKIGKQYLNSIKIPFGDDKKKETHYRSILADQEIIEGEYEDLKYLDAETEITWAVHNKPESQQVKLILQKKEALKAEGKTEQEINRFFTEAAGLFAILNPSLSIFSTLVKNIKDPQFKINSDDKNIGYGESNPLKPNLNLIKSNFINDADILRKSTLYLSLLESSTTPPEPWTPSNGATPAFETKLLKSEELDTLNTYKYAIQSIIKKDTTIIDAVKFKVGKYVRFSLSGGLAYTFNALPQNELNQDAQGNISFKNTSQSYRGIALLNLYLIGKGMLKPDDHILPKQNGCGRLFLQFGVGIPEPLTNFYTGLGYNIGPGINFSTGMHLSGQKRYEVVNNVVVKEEKVYQPRAYVSISLDTGNLIKALGLFGK